MKQTKFLIIGDQTGRRVKNFSNCLTELQLSYQVIDWSDLLMDYTILEKNLTEQTIIKLEPPEKNMEIYRNLLLAGAEQAGHLGRKEIEQLDFSNYSIVAPAQWYAGVETVFSKLKETVAQARVFCMNDPTEMLKMMDKQQTYRILVEGAEAGWFALPKKFDGLSSYEELKDFFESKPVSLFIKLRYGSGSTGVLAYRSHPRLAQEKLYTSLNYTTQNGKRIFFSNYGVHQFQEREVIKILVDWVLQNGAVIEAWIPKATYQGYAYDTRCFVLNQKAEYLISRLSKTPITNLHLKNQRRESAEILSAEQLQLLRQAGARVMQLFKNSLYAGIDLINTSGDRVYVIDLNPFGDLFHHLIGSKENLAYLQIKAALARFNGG